MLSALKWKIRSWEQEGRHESLTRWATILWVFLHNIRDRATIGRITKDLRANTFGSDVDLSVAKVCTGGFGAGIRPMQIESELAGLIQLVSERKPRVVLEIGTARGGTLFLLCRFSAEDATIISVDMPYGRNGGGYPSWKEKYYREFALPGQTLQLLHANSHSEGTIAEVRRLIGNKSVDFILIDADHSFEGVKMDFQNYLPLLSAHGIVALHDILPNAADPSVDVNRFWDELEADANVRTERIVADPDQGKYGIGVVYSQ